MNSKLLFILFFKIVAPKFHYSDWFGAQSSAGNENSWKEYRFIDSTETSAIAKMVSLCFFEDVFLNMTI
jgi:hypothetical protein